MGCVCDFDCVVFVMQFIVFVLIVFVFFEKGQNVILGLVFVFQLCLVIVIVWLVVDECYVVDGVGIV